MLVHRIPIRMTLSHTKTAQNIIIRPSLLHCLCALEHVSVPGHLGRVEVQLADEVPLGVHALVVLGCNSIDIWDLGWG